MKLDDEQLQQLTGVAIKAAQRAGGMIAQTRPKHVEHKEGVDSLASQVLTEVDGRSQSMILDVLEPTLSEFDLALLAEESPDDSSRLEKDHFWSIDPIDGTLPFIEGVAGYSVSIALVAKSGEPMLGVVFDPVEQTLYHAVQGRGAFRNGQSFSVRKLKEPLKLNEPLKLIADRSLSKETRYPAVCQALEQVALELEYAKLETLLQGGAVMNACWVLEQAPACYFKFPKSNPGGGSLWDFTATACIFREAGAWVSDLSGEPLDLNRPDSTFMNHRGVLYASSEQLAKKIIRFAERCQ